MNRRYDSLLRRGLAAALLLPGCLGMIETSEITRRTLSTTTRPARDPGRETKVRARFEGTLLVVEVHSEGYCYNETVQQIEPTRTTTREFDLEGSRWYVTEWVGGALALAAGVAAIVSAPQLSTEAPEGGGMDDRTWAYLSGAAGTAVGTGLLIAALAESVRVMDSLEVLPEVEQTVARERTPCDRQPTGGAPVEARFGALRMAIGVTSAAGATSLDLAASLSPAVLRQAPPSRRLEIAVYDRPVGALEVGDFRRSLDASWWSWAESNAAAGGYARYLQEWPDGSFAAQARGRQEELDWAGTDTASPTALRDFLGRYPDGRYAEPARNALDGCLWQAAQAGSTAELYESYLAEFPAGPHASEARAQVLDACLSASEPGRAETLLETYRAEDPAIAARADEYAERISELRNRAIRQAEAALQEAERIARGCSGGRRPETAARAYRRLAAARSGLPPARIEAAVIRIMADCGGCSPACAQVEWR